MDDLGTEVGDEPIDGSNPARIGFRARLWCGLWVKVRRQSLALVGVEGRVMLQERDPLLARSTGVVDGLLGEGVVVADGRTLLALADVAAEIERLLEGQPEG